LLKLAKLWNSLTCNISGVFCATKSVLNIMESAMSEQHFETQIISIVWFKLKLQHSGYFCFLGFSNLARKCSIQVPIAQKALKYRVPAS
jgi:hypothetical protein